MLKPAATLAMINATEQASALAGGCYRLWRVGLQMWPRDLCPIFSWQ